MQTRTFQLEEQEKELETAREIQGRLIPARIPQLPHLEIVGSYQPARVVGGDYFDVIKFSDTRVAVCIADVVGKGIAAALLTANVQAAVKAFGIVLGIFPESKYWDVTVQFDPGNKVLLFTDGITEATNTRDEEYGEARLRQRLDVDTRSKTEAMHRKLMQEVSESSKEQ